MARVDDDFFAAQDKRMEMSDEELRAFLVRRAKRMKPAGPDDPPINTRQSRNKGGEIVVAHPNKRPRLDLTMPDSDDRNDSSNQHPVVKTPNREQMDPRNFPPTDLRESHQQIPDVAKSRKNGERDDLPPVLANLTHDLSKSVAKKFVSTIPAVASDVRPMNASTGKRKIPMSNSDALKTPQTTKTLPPLQDQSKSSPIEEISEYTTPFRAHAEQKLSKSVRSNIVEAPLSDGPIAKHSTKRKFPVNGLEIIPATKKQPVLSTSLSEFSPIEQVSEIIEPDSTFFPQETSTHLVSARHSSARPRDKVIKITSLRMDSKDSDPPDLSSVTQDLPSSPRHTGIPPEPQSNLSKLNTKSKMLAGNTNKIPTPELVALNIQNPPNPPSNAQSTSKTKKSQFEVESGSKTKGKAKTKAKVKPSLVTPVEYAQKLQEKMRLGAEKRPNAGISRYLKGKKIFYVGGDMRYAGDRTRGRMDYIVKHGGTLLPTYDPSIVTHIVTDAHRIPTLRALGVDALEDIPDHIPTVKWSWVVARRRVTRKKPEVDGDEEVEVQMDDVCMHAAFVQRFDAGMEKFDVSGRAKVKAKTKGMAADNGEGKGKGVGADWGDISRISDFTPDRSRRPRELSIEDSEDEETKGENKPSTSSSSRPQQLNTPELETPETPQKEEEQMAVDDPLAEFYAQARAELDEMPFHEADAYSEVEGFESDDEIYEAPPQATTKRGFACDIVDAEPRKCMNQDIVDKLQELMELHKAKPSEDDHWRAYSYGKSLRALRNHPTRIKSYSEARSIRGVGEKTALKIMEILRTGNLRRIGYEKTEDVEATHLFQGIYGVATAFKWYASGCRTLEDVAARKGGIKLSASQEIGLQFYDDINTRMPRSEAQAIFDIIKPIALALDPKLFIEIMGSFRRGKADCGDIDILITRPVDDGKTHAGILAHLFRELHKIGVLTEDLSVPEDWNDLEAVYHGLCRLPAEGARRRRIDFLTVPWISRGAALLYYTGDDIFNRAIRFKAGKMGYSLNQRGLFGGVVRDPRNRTVKLNQGKIVASETEEEIFRILGVPWQEPHQRVRH